MNDKHVIDFLYEKSRELTAHGRPIHYLEIGVQEGGSLWRVLHNPFIQLAVGIDNWGDEYGGTGRRSPDHLYDRLGDDMGRALILTGDSHVVLPGMRHFFDMIFIDGDHSEAGCIRDLGFCLRLLRKNGVIYVDDMNHPKHSYLLAAVDKWASENKCSARLYPEPGYGVMEVKPVPEL